MYGLEVDEIEEHVFWWLMEGYSEAEVRIGVANAIKRYKEGGARNGEEDEDKYWIAEEGED